ncbi:hypothetical protein T492DRAFT_1039501 [Pavlovales sp. CCMP2436]|nr:hypothetical protein T492DRAFT_1039501 [Pavlovales sp. CCMP2436]|mmetsp:Transcript_16432/g.37912  ORF Transcript_16432/g.37912 Transcript_16432/m.37912 type:complete len:414 (-) Transcript_16432:85-1326(-)
MDASLRAAALCASWQVCLVLLCASGGAEAFTSPRVEIFAGSRVEAFAGAHVARFARPPSARRSSTLAAAPMVPFGSAPPGEMMSSSDVADGPKHVPEGALYPIFEEKLKEVGAIMLLPEARDDGPLSMRLGYMAPETNFAFSDVIRASSSKGRLAVVADMKQCTLDPGGLQLDMKPAGTDLLRDAKDMLSVGVDALLVSCDSARFGCSLSEMELLAEVLRGPTGVGTATARNPPLLAKNFVVHPIQIAQMVEAGASAVLLICALVGPDLELLLNTCTIMGVEAVVEVHTPDELLFAIEAGATAVIANRRSRATGRVNAALAIQLGAIIPGHVLSLATGNYCLPDEGGRIGSQEIEAVLEAGYDGIIVGRAFASAAGPAVRSELAAKVVAEVKRHELLQRAASWGRNPFTTVDV